MPAKDGQEADVDVITVGSWLLSRRGQSKRCAGGHDDASYGFMIDDIPEKLIILPTIVIANALLYAGKTGCTMYASGSEHCLRKSQRLGH